jgi:hypothetical protein
MNEQKRAILRKTGNADTVELLDALAEAERERDEFQAAGVWERDQRHAMTHNEGLFNLFEGSRIVKEQSAMIDDLRERLARCENPTSSEHK